jgi:FKBP-type peptidyl-prolyl cis-trans isomerase SlyD
MDQQWMVQKHQVAQQLMEHLGVDRVVIQEILDGDGGMMGGMMGGMGGGMGGVEEAIEDADLDDADLEEADVDAEELVEELEGEE